MPKYRPAYMINMYMAISLQKKTMCMQEWSKWRQAGRNVIRNGLHRNEEPNAK